MSDFHRTSRRDALLALVFAAFSLVLSFLPTGFENRLDEQAVRCRGRITAVDNDNVSQFGLIKTGDQRVTLTILDGPFAGQSYEANNPLLGKLDLDKLYTPGDVAFVVITLDESGQPAFVNPQDHFRLGQELWLLGLFSLLLLALGGWTGLKALLSFVFAGLAIWKLYVPLLLRGHDPLAVTFGLTLLLVGAIIFLVGGLNRRGLVAFLGSMLGVLTSCLLAVWFTAKLHVHGAVLPFAETLLYSGHPDLDLTGLFIGGMFLAASGAVMDLAMDVASAMDEVVCAKPDITFLQAVGSGLRVGRAVVGTMTTTLLLAYSGGYVTLLMAFMAKGISPLTMFNLVFVAGEVLKTLVGSFGLVTVAPFTALVGGLVYRRVCGVGARASSG